MEIKDLLKPCPFCGRDIEVGEVTLSANGIISLKVDCYCGIHFEVDSDDMFLVKHSAGLTADQKWNSRAEEDFTECDSCVYRDRNMNEKPCKDCKHNHLSFYLPAKECEKE